MKSAVLFATLVLTAGAAFAQTPRITNEASGLACYDDQQLLTAHNALGFYKTAEVQRLIATEQCFVMHEALARPPSMTRGSSGV